MTQSACTICRRDEARLDFHHWSYRKGVGDYACRSCHTHLHGVEIWWPLLGNQTNRCTTSHQQAVKGTLERMGVRFESWHSLMYINAWLLLFDHATYGSGRHLELYQHSSRGSIPELPGLRSVDLNIPEIHGGRFKRAYQFAKVYRENLPRCKLALMKGWLECK